jgi:DNA polymerase III delta prime subunit
MQLALLAIAVLSFVAAIIWMMVAPGFEPLLAILAGIAALLAYFSREKSREETETLDQRNRRIMLNRVEDFWVKGILEKSLYGAALLELGIKEDPSMVSYPWTIKTEPTGQILPTGKSMLQIFEEIGHEHSLLILGEPGSGKTTMLLELARQLIERARKNEKEPIPVVFNLSAWKENQTLADWLAQQLNFTYFVPKKTALEWLDQDRMLLLLDGLDEIEADFRAKCFDAVNEFIIEHGFTSIVICSRIEEYSAIDAKLSFDGAIILQPLTSKQINAYFDRFGKSLVGVKQLLRKDNVLKELVETPLMLNIVALTYKDLEHQEVRASQNIEDQRNQLFNIYIDHMFERSTRTPKFSFTQQQTERYLSWLANKMTQRNVLAFQVEDLQPSWLEDDNQGISYMLSVGLICWLIIGPITWLLLSMLDRQINIDRLIFSLICGAILVVPILGFMVVALTRKITMVDRLEWSWEKISDEINPRIMIVGLIMGVIILSGALLILRLNVELSAQLNSEVINAALLFCVIIGMAGTILGLVTGGLASRHIEETTHPGQHLRQTLFNAVFVSIITILGVGLTFVMLPMIGKLSSGLNDLLLNALRGFLLFIGLILVSTVAFFFGIQALIQHYALRLVLAQYELLPLRLIPFLEYAVDLIFLRRVGGSYIFIHRLLMEHFADMDV